MSIRPLVSFEDGAYRVDETTAAWLETRTRPFAVVACAGRFRTGKSFLLNRLLRRPASDGFGVGSTVQACTRGIWACTDFLSEDGRDVLVLDSEGIDALDAEGEHDTKIFALTVLLCSAFAYNSMSHLDEAAVQTLSMMTRVAETLGSDAHAPSLYWILRDFSLQLADPQGNPMTHAEYLEQALAPPSSSSKCATRDAIRAVFPTRHLVTLPRPHRGEKLEQAVNAKFDRFLNTFRSHLCKHAAPIAAQGVPLTGKTYVALLRTLVARVNESDVIPKLQDAWSLLSKLQHAEAEAALKERLLAHVQAECPTDTEEVVRAWIASACRAQAQEVSFMHPSPDAVALCKRLEGRLLEHARALDRVRDEEDLARSLAEATLGRFAESEYTLFHLLLEDPPSASLGRFYRDHLRVLLVGELRAIEAHFAARGREEGAVDMERLTRELEEARAREEELRAALAPPRVRTEDASTSTEEREKEEDVHKEYDAEAARMVVELESCLAAADERAQRSDEEVQRSHERERRLRNAFDESMETLRTESVAQIEAHRLAEAEAVRDAKSCRERLSVMETECGELRGMVRHAQDRAVEMHRSTLDEMRRRETEARTASDAQRHEFTDLMVRAETGAAETRALKRRVDELLTEREDAKRLRKAAHVVEVERAKEDAERDALRAQLSRARSENETLRATNLDLENRLAVSEATAKLDTCRRALS